MDERDHTTKGAVASNRHLMFLGKELTYHGLFLHLILACLIGFLILDEMYFLRNKIGPDFAQDYHLAESLVGKQPIYNTTYFNYLRMSGGEQEEARSRLGTAHPPSAGVAFLPYLTLEFHQAYRTHAFLSILLVGAAALFAAHCLRLSSAVALLLVAFSIVYGPNKDGFRYGQISPVLSALVIFSWIALRSRKDWIAGGLLGFAAALKLYPLLAIIYFVAQKRYQALIATGICFFAFAFVLPYFYLGSCAAIADSWWMYFSVVTKENMHDWLPFPPILSLSGMVANLFLPSEWSTPPFPTSSTLLFVIPSLVIVLSLPLLFIFCRKFPSIDISYVALMLLMPALAPISHPHGLFIIWPALLVLITSSTPVVGPKMFSSHKLLVFVTAILLCSNFTQIGWWEIAKNVCDALDLSEKHLLRVYAVKLHGLLYYLTIYVFFRSVCKPTTFSQ